MSFKTFLIRLRILRGLIFFGISISISCSKEPESEISISWEDDRAVGLTIPTGLLDSPDLAQLTVHLEQEGNDVPIFGELRDNGEELLFIPLIPFTRGQSYEIRYTNSAIGTVTIPQSDQEKAKPAVIEIYPTQDTLPENQLKFYIQFSRPMREGESASLVSLLNNNGDTLEGAFLDLQPELWNVDQTMLTIWLDPGRIKRDLTPNLEMGAPLEQGASYRLVISDRWRDKSGRELSQDFTKNFIATTRDSIFPSPTYWNLETPNAGTLEPLRIDFFEALDYSLLKDVFKISECGGQKLSGNWTVGSEEKSILFTPENPWKKGDYRLEIESRLEDLAGNNLNRLFEIDLLNQSKTDPASDFKRLEFEIKK